MVAAAFFAYLVVCRVPGALVRSLCASLAAAPGLVARPAGGDHSFVGETAEGGRIEVRRDGIITHDGKEGSRALVLQALKGVLPTSSYRYVVGIDEAGIGGESEKPSLAVVMFSADVGPELMAEGVRDGKTVKSDDELARLVEAVQAKAVFHQVLPLPPPSAGEPYAVRSAQEAARAIANLRDQGFLTRGVHIRVDHVDAPALRTALGALADEVSPHLEVLRDGEQYVEVAAASLLAKAAARTAKVSGAKGPAVVHAEHFVIGPHRAADKDQVLEMLQDLRRNYPDIGRWIGNQGSPGGVWDKIEQGKYKLTVARVGWRVVGLCLLQKKDDRNAKMSTFWVHPAFRGQNIGARLLQDELYRLAAQGLRRVMVTFGHEEFATMQPFFTKYGFTVDGISSQRYRDNSYEVVMGKRFDHRRIEAADFSTLAQHDLFRMIGYDIHPLDGDQFLADPKQELFAVHQLPAGRQYMIRTTASPTPEAELAPLRQEARARNATPILCSHYGMPADEELPKDVLVFDAFVVEGQLYPLHLEKTAQQDVIIPIKPEYAQRLFGVGAKQTTFGPPRLSLRSDHVYYRVDKGCKDLRRGSRVFFYVTGDGHKEVVGVALLRRIARGSPAKLHAQFGGLGAWAPKDIEDHTQGEDAMALVFDWFRRLPVSVALPNIQSIVPSFNPITTYAITHEQGDQLEQEGKTSEDGNTEHPRGIRKRDTPGEKTLRVSHEGSSA